MASFIPFTRQLGAQSGVQLNQVIDSSERPAFGAANQVFAGVGRFTRGRIDKAVVVDRNNLSRVLGAPQSPIANRLNEAYLQTYEALRNGAYQAVIQRLVPASAALSWVVVSDDDVLTNAVKLSAVAPEAAFVMAIRHLECFNEGAKFSVHAPAGAGDETKEIEFKISANGVDLFHFSGSLDPLAVDEFGVSRYLPNVVSASTDLVEVIVANNATVTDEAIFYGATAGVDNWAGRDLVYFNEGGTTYAATDYDAAVDKLPMTLNPFGYIASLGTQTPALISKLIAKGVEINKQVIVDIPATLDYAGALSFVSALNADTHYAQFFWNPNSSNDPLNGGKLAYGVSGLQVGLRCLRNAQTDNNGIAPMHYPVAGRRHMINRVGMTPLVSLTETQLSELAKAKINPVVFQTYNSGNGFVFYDSLTSAKTTGDRKLIAVAEMSAQNDDWITAYAKECLQLPISDSIRLLSDFMKALFEGEETAGWLVPSNELDGSSFAYVVRPNTASPKDKVDVEYWMSYEGTTRVVVVQQTISK